jgi:hypothetical protein
MPRSGRHKGMAQGGPALPEDPKNGPCGLKDVLAHAENVLGRERRPSVPILAIARLRPRRRLATNNPRR